MRECAGQLSEDYLPDGWERVHSSPYARVAFNEEHQLYYKEFLPRSPAEAMKALFRGSRARRARVNGDTLFGPASMRRSTSFGASYQVARSICLPLRHLARALPNGCE